MISECQSLSVAEQSTSHPQGVTFRLNSIRERDEFIRCVWNPRGKVQVEVDAERKIAGGSGESGCYPWGTNQSEAVKLLGSRF